IELEGTYPLPEAQLDRFIMRLRVGYPNPEDERQILARRGARRQERVDLHPVLHTEQLLSMQAAVEYVHASDPIERYIVSLTTAPAALAHRLLLKPELWVRGIQAEHVVRDILERTPIPKVDA